MLAPEIITRFEELKSISDEWKELLHRSSSNEVTLSPLWLMRWWQIFGEDMNLELRVVLFRDKSRLVGLAPFYAKRFLFGRCIPVRRLQLLASGEEQRHEICSDYIGIIAEKGYEERVALCFADVLDKGALGAWDELLLTALNTEHAMSTLICPALKLLGVVRQSLHSGSPYIPLPKSYGDYLNSLPGRRRSLLRRSRRLFEEWSGNPVQLKHAASNQDLMNCIKWLKSLHHQRWRSAGQAGAFASPLFTRFHDEVMPCLLNANALDLVWLSVHGEPVAILYNIVWNNRVYHYQSGRRVDFPNKIRVGHVIHSAAIERAINQARAEYDFLPGTSRYKLELSNEVRPIKEILITRPSFVEKLHRIKAGGTQFVRTLRSAWKKGTAPKKNDSPSGAR